MKLQRELHAVLAGCLLALTGWICAPLQAQQPAPEPEAAPAAALSRKARCRRTWPSRSGRL